MKRSLLTYFLPTNSSYILGATSIVTIVGYLSVGVSTITNLPYLFGSTILGALLTAGFLALAIFFAITALLTVTLAPFFVTTLALAGLPLPLADLLTTFVFVAVLAISYLFIVITILYLLLSTHHSTAHHSRTNSSSFD